MARKLSQPFWIDAPPSESMEKRRKRKVTLPTPAIAPAIAPAISPEWEAEPRRLTGVIARPDLRAQQTIADPLRPLVSPGMQAADVISGRPGIMQGESSTDPARAARIAAAFDQPAAETPNQALARRMVEGYPGPAERQPVQSMVTGESVGRFARPFVSPAGRYNDIGAYTEAMTKYRDTLAGGGTAEYPGSYQPIQSASDLTPDRQAKMQAQLDVIKGRRAERKDQIDIGRRVVTAGKQGRQITRGQAEIERTIEGKRKRGEPLSPDDIALTEGPEAAATARQAPMMMAKILGDAITGLKGINTPEAGVAAAGLAKRLEELLASGGKTAPAPQPGTPEALEAETVKGLKDINELVAKLTPETLEDPLETYNQLRALGGSEVDVNKWGERRYGPQPWRDKAMFGSNMPGFGIGARIGESILRNWPTGYKPRPSRPAGGPAPFYPG